MVIRAFTPQSEEQFVRHFVDLIRLICLLGKRKLNRNFLATQKCGCTSHKKESEQQLQGFVHAQQSGAVAAITGTIAFLPVDTVLVDSPVAHVCHARI